MISHEHRLIFIHIPRTAGTSLEKWIQGKDQWRISPKEKHLTAIEAKEMYSEYWNKYWKFSIVRNPVDRFISMLKFKDYFGVEINKRGELDITGYLIKFLNEKGVLIEHDHRFTNMASLIELSILNGNTYKKGALYGNMLGSEMDAVFNFDRLDVTKQYLAERLGLDPSKFPYSERSTINQDSLPIVTKKTRQIIQELHSLDIYPPINNY